MNEDDKGDEDGVQTGNLEVDENTMLVLKRKGNRFYVYVLSLAIEQAPESWGVWVHDMIGILADAYRNLGGEDREQVVATIMRELAIEVVSAGVDEPEKPSDSDFH